MSRQVAGAGRIQLIGAFESTYLPAYDVDIAESSGHSSRRRQDLEQLSSLGVRRVRYPVRWHRVERIRGSYDWSEVDAAMADFADLGLTAIVDLVHHTSYPAWLTHAFADECFGDAYLAYVEAFMRRYPQTREYTLFNEPFATLWLAGHQAMWPPYGRGPRAFVRVLRTVLPAVAEASRLARELLPAARHVWVDTCEYHAGAPGDPARYAESCNDRRTVALDLFLGHDLEVESRPYVRQIVEAGGEDLLHIAPGRIDVLGLDYYPHSEWWYELSGGMAPSPRPLGFAELAAQYASRYDVPLILGETNIRGLPSDRATWLRYMAEQYECAVANGVPLEGFCWFPVVDSRDWDSLLSRHAARRDPVGIFADGGVETSLTRSYAQLAAGAPAASLPAYRLQDPVAGRLQGYLPSLARWPWQDPPDDEYVPPIDLDDPAEQLGRAS
jgi:beta-glucosidase/6-phospho-beta-glucosidase/beta-galactosidase